MIEIGEIQMKTKLGLLAARVLIMASCTREPAITEGGDTLRFAVMTFAHETCTFCPGGDSDIERWTRIREPYVGDEVLSAGSYVRGFVAAAS